MWNGTSLYPEERTPGQSTDSGDTSVRPPAVTSPKTTPGTITTSENYTLSFGRLQRHLWTCSLWINVFLRKLQPTPKDEISGTECNHWGYILADANGRTWIGLRQLVRSWVDAWGSHGSGPPQTRNPGPRERKRKRLYFLISNFDRGTCWVGAFTPLFI